MASAAPGDDPEGPLGPGRIGRARCRTEDRGDGMRVVRWTHHAGKTGAYPEVVLRHLPAPGLGAGQGRCLRSVCSGARRAARRSPGASRAHPPRLDEAARRARQPTERRTGLRPRPAGSGAGPGARTGGVPATSAPHRRSPPALNQGSSTSAVARRSRSTLQSARLKARARAVGDGLETF
jgi:hypothetical protein